MIAFRAIRGTALPETALFLSLALLLVVGAAHVTYIGVSQLSVDGAAFIGAHATASNPNANAKTIVTTLFPQIAAAQVKTSAPDPTSVQAVISKDVSALTMLPGSPSTYSLTGADIEFQPASNTATPAPFSISIGANLSNYCAPAGDCELPSRYPIAIAQHVSSSKANGVNGQWSEWLCHDGYYGKLNFPNSRPTTLAGTSFDPSRSNTTENAIYSWDSGAACN